MRPLNFVALLALLVLTAPLVAAGFGDLAPRGTIAYARIKNVSDCVKRLGGEDWTLPIDRLLNVQRKRDKEESKPFVDEIRRFVHFAGAFEVALCDVMVREPHVQMVIALHLTEGAPTALSDEFLAALRENAPKEAKVEANQISDENFSLHVMPGMLVFAIGGAARTHVEDALAGDLDESLSKLERFSRWSERASADIEVWADMKALRGAIDKGGENMRMDHEIQFFLEVVEWQKWESFTVSISLPRGSGGSISLNADLTFSPQLETIAPILRPAGSSTLVRILPSEMLAFTSMQIGTDAERALLDVLKMAHDIEQRSQPMNAKRYLEWARRDLARSEARLRELENPPKEGADETRQPGIEVPARRAKQEGEPESREERIKYLKQEIESSKAEIAKLEAEVANTRQERFQPDAGLRDRRPSGAERSWDGINEALKTVGLERTDLVQVIGQEVIAGFLALPDESEDSLRDATNHLWFAAVELREGHDAVKTKVLDWMLARTLPEDADEDQRREARERAEHLMLKKVDGGEILREKGAFGSMTAFFGDNFVGICGTEEVALRILAASMGDKRFSAGTVPGGVSGSKVGYVDLGEFLARLESEEFRWSQRSRQFVSPLIEVRKLLKGGLRAGASTDESATRINLRFATSGENSLRGLLDILAREAELQNAWRHDEQELIQLGRAAGSWFSQAEPELAKMTAEERAARIKAVTPAMLVEAELFEPRDGLRSAFDPAMAARFVAMLKTGERVMGGEGGPNNLAESGYEWFGLPPQWLDNPLDADDGRPRGMWMICAHRGAWVRGGRGAVVFTGSSSRVMWLNEADYLALRSANRSGARLESFVQPEPEMPRWKARARLGRHQWQMQHVRSLVQAANQREREGQREFQLSFDGSRPGESLEALRNALGLQPHDWFPIEEIKQLTIEAKGESVRVRLKMGQHWVELNEKGETKSSFDE